MQSSWMVWIFFTTLPSLPSPKRAVRVLHVFFFAPPRSLFFSSSFFIILSLSHTISLYTWNTATPPSLLWPKWEPRRWDMFDEKRLHTNNILTAFLVLFFSRLRILPISPPLPPPTYFQILSFSLCMSLSVSL